MRPSQDDPQPAPQALAWLIKKAPPARTGGTSC